MKIIHCGLLGFGEARKMQEDLVQERKSGAISDTLLVLEHPPTLSLGLRADRSDPAFDARLWKERGVEVQLNKRGGAATYHAPGQMILYPVFSLRERGYGVREFVKRGLEGIAGAVVHLGLAADARLSWHRGKKCTLQASH